MDKFGRNIDYLRVSVTDRCNFRCAYCMPPEGMSLLAHNDILKYEEFVRIIKVLSTQGINKIRITGGEPLVRRGIVEFVKSISELGTIVDLSMTSNGSLLPDLAYRLKEAGLNRINVSLDTVNEERFKRITGGGTVAATLAGIDAALSVGLTPVKINVVLTEVFTENDLLFLIELVRNKAIAVRFIEYMPIGYGGIRPGFTTEQVKLLLIKHVKKILPASIGIGNGPARYFAFDNAQGKFGFITPITEHFCNTCNRIRLTADGKLRPCLLSEQEFDVKEILRQSSADEKIIELFKHIIAIKPQGHTLSQEDCAVFQRRMSQIGG